MAQSPLSNPSNSAISPVSLRFCDSFWSQVSLPLLPIPAGKSGSDTCDQNESQKRRGTGDMAELDGLDKGL